MADTSVLYALPDFENHYDPVTGHYIAEVNGKIMEFESEEAYFYYVHQDDDEEF